MRRPLRVGGRTSLIRGFSLVAACCVAIAIALTRAAPLSEPAWSPSPTPGGIAAPVVVPPVSTTLPASTMLGRCPLLKPSVSSDRDFALRVPILMYHRIVDPALAGRSLEQLVVPPALFAAQMSMLREAGWRTIGMATLACDRASGTRPPPKTFVVTFDDGYVDGYTEALPILRRLGYVATYYIVTGRIGWPERLTRSDVRALAADGMDIGDHTVDHINLNGRWGAALNYEIAGAAQTILAITGSLPVTFAYPFGDRSSRVVRAVADAGFEMAVTNGEGVAETSANQFQVPRVRVGPATSPEFLLNEIMGFTR